MTNLLPPKQKEELLLMERLRLILILGGLIISFLISFALILFLVKIPIERELTIARIFLEGKEKEAILTKSLKENINNFNSDLSHLNSFYKKQIKLTNLFERISQNLSKNIYLTNLDLTWLEKEGCWQVFLSGFSHDRDSLFSFKKNLEKESGFFEIYFPPENWIKSNDINFNVTFKLK